MKYLWVIFHVVLWAWAFEGIAQAPLYPAVHYTQITATYDVGSGIIEYNEATAPEPTPTPVMPQATPQAQPGYVATCPDGTPAQGSCETPLGKK